jgi:hypothetical protein
MADGLLVWLMLTNEPQSRLLGRAAAFTLVFKGKGVGGRKGSFRLI